MFLLDLHSYAQAAGLRRHIVSKHEGIRFDSPVSTVPNSPLSEFTSADAFAPIEPCIARGNLYKTPASFKRFISEEERKLEVPSPELAVGAPLSASTAYQVIEVAAGFHRLQSRPTKAAWASNVPQDWWFNCVLRVTI
jgi:hypothetical protein